MESHLHTPVTAMPVQELVLSGEAIIPERYVYKEGEIGSSIGSVPLMDVPIVDAALLSSSSSSRNEELNKLYSALTSWGCFQMINHGMTCSFLDQVRKIGKQFFDLPAEEKHKYARQENDNEGYGPDMVLYEKQMLDWTDRLYLHTYPEEHRNLRFWPQKPESFREVLHEYSLNLKGIVDRVLKAMALSLNLDENCFLDQHGDKGNMIARFNYYPPCPRPDLVFGLKPHADGSTITIVIPDKEVEGLQFLKDNEWVRIAIIPEALLINIGDQLEIMSNGVFKSPIHRAVANAERTRISIAMFCSPDFSNEIGPLDELVNENRPRLYKKVTNYPKVYFHYYQLGKRPIDSVKLVP